MVAFEIRDFAGGAADTTLAADITSGATAATLAAAVGWPSGGAAGPFGIAIGLIDPISKEFVSNVEKIRVGARTGTSLSSMVRGQDGTTALAHVTGETVRHIYFAEDADEANTAVANTVGKVTTKGDLLAATGANALDRRSVGTNDQVLIADSAQGTGMRWGILTAASLGTDSVGTDEIALNAVTASELADNAVDTAAIAAGAVTAAKIATDTITATQIAADAIGTSELAADSVGSSELAAGAIDDENHFSSVLTPVIYQSADPGAVGAGRLWFNTTANKKALLSRNAGNSAWEVLEAYDWVPYTPTYPGMAAVGNAVHFARYIRKGGVVIVNGFFRVGTTTSFSGLTNLAIALPPNAQAKDLDSFVNYPTVATAEFHSHGAARAHDDSAGVQWAAVGLVAHAGAGKALDRIQFFATGGTSSWGQTIPIAWSTNDRFTYFAEYEVATLEDSNWV